MAEAKMEPSQAVQQHQKTLAETKEDNLNSDQTKMELQRKECNQGPTFLLTPNMMSEYNVDLQTGVLKD